MHIYMSIIAGVQILISLHKIERSSPMLYGIEKSKSMKESGGGRVTRKNEIKHYTMNFENHKKLKKNNTGKNYKQEWCINKKYLMYIDNYISH